MGNLYLQEEVEARLEAERRLREAEASLSRLEKAVEKQVTKKKAAAAAAAAAEKNKEPVVAQSPEKAGIEKSNEENNTIAEQYDKADEEMIADVKTLKSELA